MLALSDEFAGSLPGGRVLDRCCVLTDEWLELLEGCGLADALEAFPA